ncbi:MULTISPECIES: hypothetical protein [unclassified Arthrobacter]|uniref:hypothetical protein n=1 Tax=unclassified Arthrobacter TaxID=235627 RepID=UPI002E01C406|nr:MULTISPECIES: hypothetical protein [unclassified Arthrobacter]MEC5189900.1 hypothetical protein [Arthrobacter sp. MP_M4]MEC5201367.1 hypothetical protein [Arthrobacter sp. MP_M7]
MSIPPVPPSNPDSPEPGQEPPAAPQYGQQPPAAPQYGQNAPQYGQNAPQYGQQAPTAPQYGQNAPQYGQQPPAAPSYGQNAPQLPQYGQQPPQYNQPAYGQSPYAKNPSEQASVQTGMPKLVNTAFWLLVASGVVWVLSLLLAIGTLDTPAMRDMFEQQMAAGGADIRFEDLKGAIVGSIVVFAVISAGLYALVALNVRKGKNWARILGTVFAALSVFSLFPLSLGTLAVLLGIAGIVMLYLPATAPYFSKRQPFANPYGQPGGPY